MEEKVYCIFKINVQYFDDKEKNDERKKKQYKNMIYLFHFTWK